MKIKTSELSGATLDWAVSHCVEWSRKFPIMPLRVLPYSTDWVQGGAIIEREGIGLVSPHDDINEWEAYHPTQVHDEYYGATPLIAAMRCYVASKLGAEVEVPEEVSQQ
jgi:hypothetical protein